MNMLIDYALPLHYYGRVSVPATATQDEIRAAIEADIPKAVTIRVDMGAGEDAQIVSFEFDEYGAERCDECDAVYEDGTATHEERCSLRPDNIVEG
jgi:hypothetical protein